MYKKILVPLDGSKMAEKILPQIENLAKCMQAELVLLTVGNAAQLDFVAESTPPISLMEFARAIKASADVNLSRVADALTAKGLKTTAIYREGNPAKEIIQCATDTGCDLIAMATHGRSELAWVLGSVTEKVVAHATLPTLIVRVMDVKPVEKKEKRNIFGGP